MKKLLGLFIVACCCSTLIAVPDIEFSPGGTTPGGWYYDGNSNFSFSQDIDIDFIQGQQTDALYDQFVFLPDMVLTSYTPSSIDGVGTGVIQNGGVVQIKDGLGNILLSGTLAEGKYMATFGTSSFYPEIVADIHVDSVDNTINSAYLDTISVGTYFDFSLTLQASENFEDMIVNEQTGSNGFSGQMTVIPEPMTIVLMGIGGVVLATKKTIKKY